MSYTAHGLEEGVSGGGVFALAVLALVAACAISLAYHD